MSAVPAIVRMLKETQFESAVPLARQALSEAAAESPERLIEVARELVAWKGFFAHTSEAIASEPYFRAVYGTLAELAGPESPAAMAAAENLASLLGSIDKIDEAISLREKVFVHVSERFPNDDTRFMTVRDGLAFLYRRAGSEDKAAGLYRNTGICEHLAAAEQYLRDQGANLVSCCRPWSANCHIWVYFDLQLDCERLIKDLGLDACIQIHDHRGTHDGSERGLVCTIHHDGLMGVRP
jgi:hypothetical protein